MKPEETLKPYILELESNIKALVENNPNELKDEVLRFLFANPKRLRPLFCFICALALGYKPDSEVQKIALALEILHSATLVHDDVLDESEKRRGEESFYQKFGSKKSIVIGDYLLSLCFQVLSDIKNPNVLKIFSDNILKTINGEINQFQTRFEFQTKEEYIKKTSAKTANLFVCAAKSVCTIFNADKEKSRLLEDFALNFGTIFQLKNDIKDFSNTSDDIKNGIYTLCLIYFKQENPTCDIMNIDNKDIEKYTRKVLDEVSQMTNKAIGLVKTEFDGNTVNLFEALCQDKLRA